MSESIQVKLTPVQGVQCGTEKIYLYNPNWVPVINQAVLNCTEKSEIVTQQSANATEAAQQATQSANSANTSATTAANSAVAAENSASRAAISETNAQNYKNIAQNNAAAAENSATIATTQATIATTKATEITGFVDESRQWAVGSLSEKPQGSSKYWAEQSAAKVQSDWNQTTISAPDFIKNKPIIPSKVSELNNDSDFISKSQALQKTQITNCVVENPQLVNLSLTNGTITITDTTVVIPYGTSAPTYNVGQSLHGGTITDISWDGAKLFYYVKYATLTRTFTTTETSDNMFLFVNTSNNILTINGTVTSGASQPEGIRYAFWYDTVNNKIKFITGSYIAEDYDTCFPIARLSTNGSIVSRINQVFQSIGYIGTFAWIGKGVKGLCPNGRNKDGSLNNTIKVNNSISNSVSLYPNRVNEFKMERADGWVQGQGSYDEDENIILDANGDKVVGFDVFAYSTNSEGQVTSFNPKTAFHAVDYYDFKNFNNTINSTKANVDLSNCTKPYVIASYRSGSSWYRRWSDGICEQGGYHAYSGNSGTATVTLLIPYTEYTTGSTTPSYSVLTNVAGTESYYNVVSVIKERTGESFVVMYASSASESANVSGFYWQATGYTTWGL